MAYIVVRNTAGELLHLHSSYPPVRVKQHEHKPVSICYFADGVREEVAMDWPELAARYEQGGYGPHTQYGRGDTPPAGLVGTADEREQQIADKFTALQERADLVDSGMKALAQERDELRAEKAAHAREKTAAQEREVSLTAYEANLGRRREELDAREASLTTREQALAQAQATLASGLRGPTDPAATGQPNSKGR